MAALIDTNDYAISTAAVSTLSKAIAVAANANRALVAIIGNQQSVTALNVSGVAYTVGSGGAWTPLGSVTNAAGDRRWEIWTSSAPSTGAVTVQATYSGTNDTDLFMEVYSVYNADQATPANNFASTGVGNVATLNVAGDADGIQLFGMASNVNPDPITSGTQDQADVGSGTYWRVAHQTASPTATFTYTTGGRGLCGCNVKAAAGGGAPPALMGAMIF